MLERATLLTDHQQEIKLHHLFPQMEQHEVAEVESQNLADMLQEGFSLEAHERQLIDIAMQKAKQNISEAARLLGMSRAALDYRLKKRQLS